MNKILSLGILVALSLSPMTMRAEDGEPNVLPQKVTFTMKGGLSINNVSTRDELSSYPSLKLGVGVEIPLNKDWSIEPAVYYAKKKFTIRGSIEYTTSVPSEPEMITQLVDEDFRNSLRYIEVPIFLGKRIDMNNAFVKLKAGGFVAYGLTARAKYHPDHEEEEHCGFYITQANYFKGNMFKEECSYGNISYLKTGKDDADLVPLRSGPYHRWDAGVAFGVDIASRHFIMGVDFMISCKPFTRHFNGKYTLAHQTVSLMIGRRF